MGRNTPKITYKFIGANNVDDPTEVAGILAVDPTLILSEMSQLVNVDTDNNGKVSRRKGYTYINSTAPHSMWSNNKNCYFVENGFLKQLNLDNSVSIVSTLPTNNKLVYEEVNNVVVISDGTIYKILQDNVLYDPIPKNGITPVGGQILKLFKGRLYIANGSNIYFTLPYDIETLDTTTNIIPMPSYVKMIIAVEDGLFVSDSNAIYFLKGESPEQFEVIKIANYPAIEGTAMQTRGEIFGEELQGVSDTAGIFATTQGICVVGNNGFFKNISKYKYQYKPGTVGTAVLKEQNGITQYVMNTYKEEDEHNIYIKNEL